MRYARDHTINNRKRAKGDAFTGDTNTGRFLYHRGVLEPDGSENDAAITGLQDAPVITPVGSDFATSWNPPSGEGDHNGS